MPRYVKDGHSVETSVPRLAVRLKAAGYTEQKARTKRVREADAERTETETDNSQETQVVVHDN